MRFSRLRGGRCARAFLVCLFGSCWLGSMNGVAAAQTALPDPMAAPLPNPMAPMAHPMMPAGTAPSASTPMPNPMAAPAAPNPMPPGGGLLNPMVQSGPAESGPSGGEAIVLREDLGNLPDGPGVEDTYYMCTA